MFMCCVCFLVYTHIYIYIYYCMCVCAGTAHLPVCAADLFQSAIATTRVVSGTARQRVRWPAKASSAPPSSGQLRRHRREVAASHPWHTSEESANGDTPQCYPPFITPADLSRRKKRKSVWWSKDRVGRAVIARAKRGGRGDLSPPRRGTVVK